MAMASTCSVIGMLPLALLAIMIGSAQSFLPVNGPLATHHQSPSSSLMQSMKPNELFESPGWGGIEQELDQVPIFAVANEQGQPIKYKIEKKDATFEVPLFYTHVGDALKELEKAKENNPLPGMDINPYPLGGIFRMWATDAAVIVPNKMSIIQAGAPPNANPMGQQVPLFACMEIAQENEKGKPVLPLFFELEDANNAVSQAVSFDGGKEEDFEVVCLNLPEAVNLLANSEENAFQFIPPTSSLEHIRDYLSG
mmetsp:Transcript_10657/g.18732  ORF Transcript_10657/g.18732 Transcript_10657/m.18732 type:complete len:254 (+) Transcript_10657:88-849(+)|eukprot:CAMPEP_0183727058 /NCGR_PEP_ID=MMETSP0737-20130205/24714_1 /TAXON_ID=385413 /ORGANISM="Thalassiosira miniscula, Strain CCMP1093" /LENGTH=253 /DNA_ID=CAMNT_0025958583 /DNA_START=12 /DNA_END=773 /DNA_ORIENTATION=+